MYIICHDYKSVYLPSCCIFVCNYFYITRDFNAHVLIMSYVLFCMHNHHLLHIYSSYVTIVSSTFLHRLHFLLGIAFCFCSFTCTNKDYYYNYYLNWLQGAAHICIHLCMVCWQSLKVCQYMCANSMGEICMCMQVCCICCVCVCTSVSLSSRKVC